MEPQIHSSHNLHDVNREYFTRPLSISEDFYEDSVTSTVTALPLQYFVYVLKCWRVCTWCGRFQEDMLSALDNCINPTYGN